MHPQNRELNNATRRRKVDDNSGLDSERRDVEDRNSEGIAEMYSRRHARDRAKEVLCARALHSYVMRILIGLGTKCNKAVFGPHLYCPSSSQYWP